MSGAELALQELHASGGVNGPPGAPLPHDDGGVRTRAACEEMSGAADALPQGSVHLRQVVAGLPRG